MSLVSTRGVAPATDLPEALATETAPRRRQLKPRGHISLAGRRVQRPRPVRLLVVMPALNEAASIRPVIEAVPRKFTGVDRVDVLVIDDGSTDDTAAVAKAAGADVVSHHTNMGLGVVMQTAIDEALRRGVDYLVNIDSDGQFDPNDIPRLLSPLLAGRADFASASRFKDPELVPKMPWLKRVGNWGMSKIVSAICGGSYADVSCGFRAYPRDTLMKLTLAGKFTYTQETFVLLAQRNLRIVEVPLKVRGEREIGTSRIASNLLRYAYRTTGIIYSCIRDYNPGALFNVATLSISLTASGFAAFFLWHRIVAGQFTPHIWAGFLAAFLFGVAFVTFWVGQVALMIARTRRLQEQQLYLLRKHVATVEVGEP